MNLTEFQRIVYDIQAFHGEYPQNLYISLPHLTELAQELSSLHGLTKKASPADFIQAAHDFKLSVMGVKVRLLTTLPTAAKEQEKNKYTHVPPKFKRVDLQARFELLKQMYDSGIITHTDFTSKVAELMKQA